MQLNNFLGRKRPVSAVKKSHVNHVVQDQLHFWPPPPPPKVLALGRKLGRRMKL